MTGSHVDRLAQAHAAFDERDWAAAMEHFDAAARSAELGGADLYRWAESAWWVGDIDLALETWERSHDQHLEEGDGAGAAMAAMFLACHSLERGEVATGSAWRQRTERLLQDLPEGPWHGYPLYFHLFDRLGRGDLDEAAAAAQRMRTLGTEHTDLDLAALATLGEGRCC